MNSQPRHPRCQPLLWVVLLALVLCPASLSAARVPWTSNRIAGSPNPPSPFTIERAFPGVNFQRPVEFAFLPGSPVLLVADQNARLWSFDTRSTSPQTNLVLDLRPLKQPLDNIIGFTIHPGFATNRYIFVNYNEGKHRTNGAYVSRFEVTSLEPLKADPASEKMIIRWLSGGHNGCTLAFGPDGFLYISTGDAADPDPPDRPFNTGQDISDLLSSVLRIDVSRAEGTNAYAIPRDNPFTKHPGARPEVWAFGFRNPFRMSFAPDRALWVGDVGWEQWEMIYRVRAGGNYGWSITEGPNTRVRTDVKPGPGPILPPMVSLPHSEAASITGGRFYNGKKFPRLRGAYIYGDWETGKFWALRHDGDKLVSNEELCDTTLQPISFCEDGAGELLILDYQGGLYQFAPNPAPPANRSFPRKLSETGLFTSVPRLTPAPGVEPYSPMATMWNDGASASHLLGIPGDSIIVTTNARRTIAGGMWYFPANTVLARTLTLEMRRGEPASSRRIETQLLHFDGQAWNPYTYRWDAAQADAALVPSSGTNDTFTVADASAPGGRREIPWRFASQAECLRCHNAWAGETISLGWVQLNALATNGELRRLERSGLIEVKNIPRNVARLVNPHDASLPLEDRARSWLHVNCAACHRKGAGGAVPSHFQLDTKLADSRYMNVPPTRGDFGLEDARVVAPGHPWRSALLWRISTEGGGHMPAIGSRTVDETGARLVRDWIAQLPAASNPADSPIVAGLSSFRSGGKSEAAVLLASSSGALALANELPALKPELATAAVSAARQSTNALVRDLFERFLPSGQRRRTLGLDFPPQSVLSLRGDAARGRAVFLNEAGGQCARCHRAHGAGRDFGPDLTDLRRKYDRAAVLEHILQPNKLIAPEHRTHSVLLSDDTELTGFVKQRSATELLLRLEDGTDHRVSLAQVQESRESALSAMPEGLLAALTAQEAADLLEFLLKEESSSSSKK
jgi:putative heme-binding domain-containing protein